jgi:quercetin dioxygenase-like cupin family protein
MRNWRSSTASRSQSFAHALELESALTDTPLDPGACQDSGDPKKGRPTYKEERMNKVPTALIAAAAVVLTVGSIKIVSGQATSMTAGKLMYVSPDTATYKPMMPGVSMAVLWGDPDKGAHGTFTKFQPAHDAGMHSHTNDVWIVGVKGAYLYKDDAGDKRVGPGEFLRVPGGHKHWSGGDKADGALFYEEGSGKFDLVPAK